MTSSTSFQARRMRLLAIYAACCLLPIVLGAVHALETNSNSPLDWVPDTFPPRAAYDAHAGRFGPGDVVVMSWPGCTIDEPRLDELVRVLEEDDEFHSADGTPLFEQVSCGRQFLEQLTSGPAPISRATAVSRLRNRFVGPDGLQTCVIVTFTSPALRNRARLVDAIQERVHDACGIAEDEQHLAGPVIDGLSVDRAGRASLDRLALPSAVVVLLLACLCLRSFRAGLIVFGLSVFCQAATLALIHYSGESMSALLIVLPPLVQVLAVAGGVHLTNYYFDALPEHGAKQAPWQALRMGWMPCVLSASTTALGIGSLIVSQLSPIRSFGIFASAGVLLTTGLLLLLVPTVWAHWPPRLKRSDMEWDESDAQSLRDRLSVRMTGWMSRYWDVVLAVVVLSMIWTGSFLKDLKTSVRIETLFADDSRVIGDYRWLEEHVGPLVPIDIVVSWPEESSATQTERLRTVWEIQQATASMPEVGSHLSAVQFLPALPSAERMPPEMYDQALEQTIDQSRPGFTEAGFLVEEGGRQYWRITAGLSALSKIDYSRFLEQVREVVEPRVAAGADAGNIEVAYAGIMPLVHEIQRQLMRDLVHSFLGALVLITIVMTLAQAGVRAGLAAMIPNVFPILLLFGALGSWGAPLDIGTVMTASVALGISVDDTLHFLTFFQQALIQRRTRQQAVAFAYRHCGAAMIQTSVICGLGLLVFSLAEFAPTRRFAWVTASLIALALVADLVLLPALLLSPLGRWFGGEEEDEREGENAELLRGPRMTARREQAVMQ